MGFDASVLKGGLAAWREASGWTAPPVPLTAQKETKSPVVRA